MIYMIYLFLLILGVSFFISGTMILWYADNYSKKVWLGITILMLGYGLFNMGITLFFIKTGTPI
jgi:hypothetical protein